MSMKDRKIAYLAGGMFLLLGLLGLAITFNSSVDREQVKIQIQMPALQADMVEIMGSFNNWQKQCCLEQDPSTGIWSITLSMAPGIYEYVFVVDGKLWAFDNSEGRLGDGLGGRNAVLYVNKMGGRKGGGDV